MQTAVDIKKKLERAFEPDQADVLSEVITEAYSDLVKTGDFNELKGIVKELAEAQRELAGAQKRTETRVEELAEAQRGLAEAQRATEKEIRVLVKGLTETRQELGGLSRSFSYSFENEAYRMLPEVLKRRYHIKLKERLLRTDIGGKEVNLFGKGAKNGSDVIVVGEVKLRLDDKRKKKGDVFEELEEKVRAVRKEYKKEEIIRLLLTHYATSGFLKRAKEKGVIVVQSFEW